MARLNSSVRKSTQRPPIIRLLIPILWSLPSDLPLLAAGLFIRVVGTHSFLQRQTTVCWNSCFSLKPNWNQSPRWPAASPHSILGMHPCETSGKSALVVRAFVDDARSASSRHHRTRRPPLSTEANQSRRLSRPHRVSLKCFNYRLRIERYNGEIRQFYDPYVFFLIFPRTPFISSIKATTVRP